MSNFLLEIGTEELPRSAYEILESALQRIAAETFKKNRLAFKELKLELTPRRAVLFIENLAARQEDQTLQFSGPSHEKAFTPEGQPTPALQGFLKSKNAKLDQIEIKDTPKGKFITLSKREVGKATPAILPSIIKEIFDGLVFPKTMRWEATGVRFPRPIRWIVALLDNKVIRFKVGDVEAGNQSFGHRFLAPQPIKIKSADLAIYAKQLKKAHVILRLKDREELIRKALRNQFHQKDFDEELVRISAEITEEPFMLSGGFSKSYLDLPAEVLASCMKKNQKIFACYDARGKLMNKFVAVLNGKRKGLSRIRADYENVLESRLRDARFFYDADRKESLDKRFDSLEQIVYLGKLGSMKDKSLRLEKLAEKVCDLIGRKDLSADLKRTAHLAKIDLMTHLVYEFPDLQGIAGREYAIESGEKEEVALAIGTQYLPKNLAENYKDIKNEISPLGALFGIIDRLDLLVGAFGMGLEPTGSQDPYALRRAGGAVIKLIRAYGFPIKISEAIRASYDQFHGKNLAKREEFEKKLTQFFEDRVIFELQVKPGTRSHEILTAVMRSNFDQLSDVFRRYEVLSRMYEQRPDSFLKAAKVVERTSNILKGVSQDLPLNPDLYKESLEKRLYELLDSRSEEIKDLTEKRDYEAVTLRFGEVFYQPIHDFFDQVMVNVEDTSIRQARQALMKHINRLYTEKLADLSVLSRLDQG